MRTYVLSILVMGLTAVPAARAEDEPPAAAPTEEAPGQSPSDDEARLQELERILEETAPKSDPDADSAPDPDADPDADPDPAPDQREKCGRPVLFRRGGVPDPVAVRLQDCSGEPSAEAITTLSALAQPAKDTGEPAQQLNPGLLSRLQRLADAHPGAAIEIVSGVRPNARPGSRHRSGDALDLRIDGVDHAQLAELARGFEGTGVGFYPNSTFIHIDVRDESAFWIDRSLPGQSPDYGPWPPVTAADAAPEPTSEAGSESTSESESESESGSEAGSEAGPESESGSAGDPELQVLLDRALLVMNQALASPLRAPMPAPADDEAQTELL